VTSLPSLRQPDVARANDQHSFRHVFQRKRTSGRDDALFIDGDARQRRHIRPGGDDDVLRLQSTRAAVLQLNFDLARRADPCLADNGFALVLLEQEFDTLGELAHHFRLVRHHRGQIEFGRGFDP